MRRGTDEKCLVVGKGLVEEERPKRLCTVRPLGDCCPGEPRAHWAFFSSQWRPGRFGAFPIDRGSRVEHFVEARRDPFGYWPEPSDQTPFRVPAAIAGAHLGEWRLPVLEALPRLHRAPRLDARQLRAVCSGIQVIGNDVVRPDGVPDSWVPIHLEPATGPRQQAGPLENLPAK